VAWENFDTFIAYAAQLNPYLPAAWLPMVGWGVTLAEVACGLALIAGFQTRKVAVGSGLLLLAFALGLTAGFGVKAPFNYWVFSAAAGTFLLATSSHDPVSIDRWRDWQTPQGTRQQQASASTTSATGRACGGMRSMGSRTPVQPSVGAMRSPSPACGSWWG
jgi:uncharacterized membrane protein YphA (DoxX/SURF4 family)